MSKIYELPNMERISDEASLWLAKLDRGLSVREEKEFQHWMVRDRRHRETLFRMAKYWDKMDSLSRLSDLFPPTAPKNPFVFARAAGLAVLAAGLVLSWVLLQAPASTSSQQVVSGAGIYETAVGKSALVDLPDSSKALLNTDTLIHTRYSGTQRYIVLERGEAHFTVAKDSGRPFIVHAGGKIIQAVGTAFNVKLQQDNQVALVVTEGRVAVGANPNPFVSGEKMDVPSVVLSKNSATVSQGEAAVLDIGEFRIEKISPEKLVANLSWRDGNIIFEGETLQEALDEISRYTTMEIDIVDDRIRNVRVAGVFKSGDIDGLLMTLHENFDIASLRAGDGRIQLALSTEP